MKSYRVLAWKELLAQKVTSILILIAVILSTVTTTVIGQSIGVLNAMSFAYRLYGSPLCNIGILPATTVRLYLFQQSL